MLRASLAVVALASLAWSEVPECNLAPGWQQTGPRRTYEGESLYEYMNGNSEGYLIYGFRKMAGVSCGKDGATIIVDVSDMGDAESAFGIFSANRDVRSAAEPIGMGAQVLPRKVILAKGRYYLEIAVEPEGDYREMLRAMAATLASQVHGRTTPPEALAWFPVQGLQNGSPRLIPQSVLGIRALKRGYVAQYENGSKAFVVADASPEAAAATMDKLKARLTDVGDLKVGDGGFMGRDKYLGTMAILRKGSYVAGYSGIPDSVNAAALSTALAVKIQ
ncbi:MAG: DUF6599 family protein [Bryobacteraceae bacterium]|nr:DUF6599 family protein [Bryobacteraceae bacterium]